MLSLILETGYVYSTNESLKGLIKDMLKQDLTVEEAEDLVAGWVGAAYMVKVAAEEDGGYEKALFLPAVKNGGDTSMTEILRGFQNLAEEAEEMYPGICRKCEKVARESLKFSKLLEDLYASGDPDVDLLLQTKNLA